MYENLLVPLDGSAFSEHALPLALSIARRAGAAVKVVHVHQALAMTFAEGAAALDESVELQIKAQQRHYLKAVVERLARTSSVPVEGMFLEGDPASTLRAAAVKAGTNLVVMTTHGRGALGRFWLGSVTDELLRDLPMPALLVRPHGAQPTFTPEPELKHILLPLDGTALAEQMLEPAFQLGSLFGADYTLLRVIKPVMPLTYSLEGYDPVRQAQSVLEQIERLHGDMSRDAQSYLDGVARRLRERAGSKPPNVRTRVVLEHQPAAAILTEAEPPTDLIALETHGRRGLARLLRGSVADKVIRGATLPVLVHKPLH